MRSTKNKKMVNVQIKMISGETYRVSNPMATSLKDFVKKVLAPYGTTQTYVEIFPELIIASANIESMSIITEEEIVAEFQEAEEVEKADTLDEVDRKLEEAEEGEADGE